MEAQEVGRFAKCQGRLGVELGNKKTSGGTVTSGGFFFEGSFCFLTACLRQASINGPAIFYYFCCVDGW